MIMLIDLFLNTILVDLFLFFLTGVLTVTQSLGSDMDTLNEDSFPENINLLSQPPHIQTPTLYAHQNVTLPQVAGG